MGQPKEARLTPEVAQQICERTASAVVLEGSIASLGSQYVLGLRAKNCNTGDILDQEQVAGGEERRRSELSESDRSQIQNPAGRITATVEKHSTPLAEATTPSLEALKAYSTGMKLTYPPGLARPSLFTSALSKSIPNSRWRTPIWGLCTALLESRCCQPRARRKPGNCGIVSAIGKSFSSTLPTIGR